MSGRSGVVFDGSNAGATARIRWSCGDASQAGPQPVFAVGAAGLSPSDFEWDHRADDDEAEARLEHRPSGAYFIFRGSPGTYSSSSRAEDHPVRDRTELSWYRLMQQVELWLAEVKRDIETPDLWAQLHSSADVLTAAAMDAIETNRSPRMSKQRLHAGWRN